ncbi:putative nucleotidyltransferase [Kribbella flavida DSM 17836]|uniref:Putative nucleotidyltransferase n=1 Tax=Kribbella flavida (strain DSM 17836 / JCM 10339 / NBRC 14399) TaxID=479435 RepID=D2PWE8_KRIFD|nr:nucleotidyltransferase domain-containing protein [Kribbella flavida]ADB31600.1 putative nucleotidyltransferase [Kribbella flavida DSM 17836]
MTRVPDPLEAARRLAAEFFPDATWVILSGSVLTSARTDGSDLDLVVLLPEGSPEVPRRESLYYAGWPVELFLHDTASLDHYLAKELPGRRPVMNRMIAQGTPVTGDPGSLRTDCQRILAAGPGSLTAAETDSLRYALTDLLDDLTHASPDERPVIATVLWLRTADATLGLHRHWIGTGKWMLRELRDHDPQYAAQWLAAQTDLDQLTALARQALALAGGPLFAGYRVQGERPPS